MTGSGEGVNEVGGSKFLTEQPKGVDPTKTSLPNFALKRALQIIALLN